MPIIEVPGHGPVEFPDGMPQEQLLAALRKLAPPSAPPVSAGEAFGRGAMQGLPNKLLAGGLADAEQRAAVREPQYIPGTDQLDIPMDAGQYDNTYRGIRQQQQQGDAAARQQHPGYHLAGAMAPAVASLAIPAAGPAKGASFLVRTLQAIRAGAITGAGQAAFTSEGEGAGDVLKDTLLGGGLGAAFGGVGEAAAQGVGAAARSVLPRAVALRDRLAQALGDKAARPAEAIARSAQGTSGSTAANASRTIERLGMEGGLPANEIAANEAALATPEAQALATRLAGKARGELPDKLAHMQSAEALAAQAAQDEAAARAYGQTTGYAWDSIKNRAGAQAKRYAIPIAAGTIGALTGDDNSNRALRFGLGAAAGRGISPGVNAVVRNLILSPEARRLGMEGVVSGLGSVGSQQWMSDLARSLTPEQIDAAMEYLRSLGAK